MSDFLFSGLNLALATPFDSEGRIDFALLERNIERYIAAGIRSFVPKKMAPGPNLWEPTRH